ncbi:MAG: SDR family oxidoreductase [Thermoleophilia bacterium]
MPENVLITGAGRGLGLELARLCSGRGDHVVATVRDTASVAELAALPGVTLATLDLSESDSVSGAIAELAERAGGMDLVINNAAVNFRGVDHGNDTLSVETMSADPMLDLFRVNVVGPLLVVKGALRHLTASGHGRVVNVSSWLASVSGFAPGAAANYGYRTTKAALVMATRALAAEVGPMGVTAIAVNPGWMRTEMGGERAELDPADSAVGILDVAARLTPTDGGRFIDWDGTDHPY